MWLGLISTGLWDHLGSPSAVVFIGPMSIHWLTWDALLG